MTLVSAGNRMAFPSLRMFASSGNASGFGRSLLQPRLVSAQRKADIERRKQSVRAGKAYAEPG